MTEKRTVETKAVIVKSVMIDGKEYLRFDKNVWYESFGQSYESCSPDLEDELEATYQSMQPDKPAPKRPEPIGEWDDKDVDGQPRLIQLYGCPHCAGEDGLIWSNARDTNPIPLSMTETLFVCSVCYQAILGYAMKDIWTDIIATAMATYMERKNEHDR